MDRVSMINRIGKKYVTSNIEGGEFSYVQAAGSKENLVKNLGFEPKHFKADIRFEFKNVAVIVETKQNFKKKDEEQLKEYVAEEMALFPHNKIIAVLANTADDKIKVWKDSVSEKNALKNEVAIDTMEHYVKLFEERNRQNDRERVLKNTYALNETLHKKDIDERLRSQFVGTALLYIKDIIKRRGISVINEVTQKNLKKFWNDKTAKEIRTGIEETLDKLLDGSDNKALKIELLQRNVLNDQKVKKLSIKDWVDILDEIVGNIYKYINDNSVEGQDILNLFFIAFNKYTGKADKNQAFTPDHITDFMCRAIGVDGTKRIFDGACGSGSFLVKGMVLEFANINRQKATEEEKEKMRKKVVKEQVFGVEIEEKAFGLSVTNMLIHGDGNSNIINANLFDSKDFFKRANPDIILMNPPYNAKPINIPPAYKKRWKADSKEDPSKGLVFVKFLSDIVREMNKERLSENKARKEVKLAVLLPVAVAIGNNSIISAMKTELLEYNTLEAVFTLPSEVFYPGASASACCMVFTFGRPHINADGTVNKTFFGYYKEDGHKKKKNLGRIEQFDKDNKSLWKPIEEEWLDLFRNKTVKEGISAMQVVSGEDEWLCEAYMKTDYSKLCEADFQRTLNDYCSYLVKLGHYPNLKYKISVAPILDIKNWREFCVSQIFTHIESGKITKAGDLEEGEDLPYLGAKKDNNGVMQMCQDIPDKRSKGNCVIMIGDGEGSVGLANYMESDFLGTVNLVLGYNEKHLNVRTGLFLATVLSKERDRYSFGRKWKIHIPHTIIKLPADKDNNPDWKFMENYIKSLPYGDRLEG